NRTHLTGVNSMPKTPARDDYFAQSFRFTPGQAAVLKEEANPNLLILDQATEKARSSSRERGKSCKSIPTSCSDTWESEELGANYHAEMVNPPPGAERMNLSS